MFLVSIYEREKSLNFHTVESLNEFFRGLCSGLDVQKFLSMSNFNLFFCCCNIPNNIDCLLSDMNLNDNCSHDYLLFEPINENLADSVYNYMSDNLDAYFDIVKSIDEYREKVKNYKLDK